MASSRDGNEFHRIWTKQSLATRGGDLEHDSVFFPRKARVMVLEIFKKMTCFGRNDRLEGAHLPLKKHIRYRWYQILSPQRWTFSLLLLWRVMRICVWKWRLINFLLVLVIWVVVSGCMSLLRVCAWICLEPLEVSQIPLSELGGIWNISSDRNTDYCWWFRNPAFTS